MKQRSPAFGFASLFALAALLCAFAPALQRAALAAERTFAITIEKSKFDLERIDVKAGEVFELKVTNKDKSFEEFESNSLVLEKFVKPGKTISLRIGPLKPGEYEYFLDFHPQTGKGKIVVAP